MEAIVDMEEGLFRKGSNKSRQISNIYVTTYCKNIVANKLADKCEIQISYAIGVKEPLSIYINTFETGKYQMKK